MRTDVDDVTDGEDSDNDDDKDDNNNDNRNNGRIIGKHSPPTIYVIASGWSDLGLRTGLNFCLFSWTRISLSN